MEILYTIFKGGLLCVGILLILYLIYSIVSAFITTRKKVRIEMAKAELEYFNMLMDTFELEEHEEKTPKKKSKK